MDYKVLAAELEGSHPVTGPYSADDAAAAGEINALNIVEPVDVVAGAALFNVTDTDEYSALTQDDKSRWLGVCAIDAVDVGQGVARAEAKDIFGNASQTWANLAELKSHTVSRAGQLNLGIDETGAGTVTARDVTYARSGKFDPTSTRGARL